LRAANEKWRRRDIPKRTHLAPSDESEPKPTHRRVKFTRATDVAIEHMQFAVDGRVPLGAVTLVVGVGGQGKSTLTTTWAAQITRGTLCGDLYGGPADIAIASVEDARGAVLKPRLIAAGADLDRVHFVDVIVDDIEETLSLPDDLEQLEAEMKRHRVRFLIIDPLIAHLPLAINADRDQHVRHALAPLAKLAERLDVAITGIMHLNKRDASDIMVRVNGSGGFVNAARSVLVVGADPEDPDQRIVAHGKSNVGILAPSERFKIETRWVEDDVKTSGIAFLGEVNVTASDLVRGEDGDRSALDEAVEWLADRLDNGPVSASQIKIEGERAAHSFRTLQRAKKELRVKSIKTGDDWKWSLPAKTAKDAKAAPVGDVGGVGVLESEIY
jgi:hypothetical protein